MMNAATKSSNGHVGLRPNALGFPTLLAQSIALISPTMTAVLIIPLAFASAGEGTWLAYAFGTAMLLFVVYGLNQFARRSAHAGSMYAYTGRGLGATAGVFSGWTLIWSYLFIAVAGLCGFAIFAGQFLAAAGFHGTVPPIAFFALCAAACWYIAYKDIRVSSLLTLALECLSVACILALAGVVLFSKGFAVDTAQFTLRGVGPHGMALAVVACIFSLVGFESATALGSEAKKPLRTVPKAVTWSLVITGLFFVLVSYVEVVGTKHYPTSLGDITAPLNVLATIYNVTFFKIPLSLCAMGTFFSLSLSCLTAGTRILYPMARHGVFVGHLGRAHATNRTPHIAITVYITMIFLVAAGLELFSDPLSTFGNAGTLAAFGFLLAYYLIAIAAPMHLRKRHELRPVHVVMAAIGVVCLAVPTIGSFYPLPPYPVRLFPYLFLGYMAIGGGWLYLVSRGRPGILAEIEADMTRSAHLVEEPVDTAPPAIAAPLVEPVTFEPLPEGEGI